MIETLEKKSPRLNNKLVHGRTINAVAGFLRKQLHIPHVYLAPKIAGVPSVDVFAVDRAGSGDLHAVKIKGSPTLTSKIALRSMVDELKAYPFHFKYLALPRYATLEGQGKFADYPELFDKTGIGRIGILYFDADLWSASSGEGISGIQMLVQPERFRVIGKELAAVERFLAKAKPDMEVRI